MMRTIMRLLAAGGLIIGGWLLWQHYHVPPTPIPQPLPLSGSIERIVIHKSDRTMIAYQDGKAVREYKIALGFAPEGDKIQEGDGKTPEGLFSVNRRNDKSKFHLSLGIDYPQKQHLARAETLGVLPGGDIFIHGQPNKYKDGTMISGDWTAGCVAVSNTQMEELWRVTPIGTPVEILP